MVGGPCERARGIMRDFEWGVKPEGCSRGPFIASAPWPARTLGVPEVRALDSAALV